MPLFVRFMQKQDVPQVAKIDREAFPNDWPPTNYSRELQNRMAYYIVACESNASCRQPDPLHRIQSSTSILSVLKRFFIRKRDGLNTVPVAEELLVGYAGMWILADEAHVTSIASRSDYRHRGIGEALLVAMIEMAIRRKARIVTLEARVSNTTAQNLYLKFGLSKMGIRKGYYLDNREDAVIMSTEFIGSPAFQERLDKLKKMHVLKWGLTLNEIETPKGNPVKTV